jgi:hypothetical protein
MNFTCHIHSCETAKDRRMVMQIAAEVSRTANASTEDLVEDILFHLDARGLDDAHLRANGAAREVVLAGHFHIRWDPVATTEPGAGQVTERPNHDLSLRTASSVYRIHRRRLKHYQDEGLLPSRLSVRVMDAFVADLSAPKRRTVEPRIPHTLTRSALAPSTLPAAMPA